MRPFICYSSGDKAVAERIAVALNEQGVSPWLDKWEIYPGESLTDRIADALSNASALVVLLNPQSSTSRWVREELRIALQKRLSCDDFKIYPVLLETCELPQFLRDYRYIDARKDLSTAIAELIVALKRIPLGPPTVPDAPQPQVAFSSVVYDVTLSGEFGALARFHETFEATALKTIRRIPRSIDPCGEILEAKTVPYRLHRRQASGRTEKWVIEPSVAIPAGTSFHYEVHYQIRDAFPEGKRDWTYAIEAPTDRLDVCFDFRATSRPRFFSVSHRVGQTLYPEPTEAVEVNGRFKWSKLVPVYKDAYEFAFDW